MSSGRKYSFSDALFSSTFIHNPVLIQAAGLCAIVAVATTLKTAVLLAAAFFPVLIITQVFACLALKRVPRWIRVAIYLLIGTAIIAGIIYAIDTFMPEISLGAGIYLALTAANSIIALHCEKLAIKTDLRHAFFDSIATALGYAAVIIPVGALREMIGSSTIWGANIKIPMTYPAILMPFGGFLVLAFFAAALKALINKRFPEHSAETEMKIKKTSVIRRIFPRIWLPPRLRKLPQKRKKRLPKQKRLLKRKRLSKSKRPLKPKTPKRTTWHTSSRSTARANLTFPISSPKTTKTKMTRTTARRSTACSTRQRILTPTRRRRETNEHDLVF